MASSRSIFGLDEEDHYYFKVYKVVVCEARIILLHIFNWGCVRNRTQSFRIHAKENLKMNNRQFKIFDNSMKELMDKNPSGDKFDVSMLCACIIATGNLDVDIINPIKSFRNNIIHNIEVKDEATMDTLIQQLRDLLVHAIKKAEEVYKRPNAEIKDVIKSLDDNIKRIKQCPLNVTDVTGYRQSIVERRKTNETLVGVKGVPSLKDNFKELSHVDPASWISGKKRLNVKTVFTRLDITKTKDVNSYKSVSHEELLELQTEDGKKPTVIVVEGDAGCGKSTLAKFILADWADLDPASPSPIIRGLEQYELVLYVECKNRNLSSFLDLLLTLMPHVSYDMTDTDFIRSVLAKCTLVVVDGLDEMNENSEKLLKEMLGDRVKMSEGKMHFIITTRPQKKKSIPTLCGSNQSVHIKITGIPPERRVEFVERLHGEMIKEHLSVQNTSHLVNYVKQSQSRLGEYYRWPLNLTLLTYLWASDTKTVNSITSATSLYVKVLKLLKSRVISRIQDAHGSTNKLEDNVTKFLEILFAVYLKTHKSGSMQLSNECQNHLMTECDKLGLPFDDMCGAFFSVDSQYTYYGNQIYLSAPHKSIMEFFCAIKFFNCLIAVDDQMSKEFEDLVKKYDHRLDNKAKKLVQEISKPEPKTLKNVLENLLNENDDGHTIDFSHYQNVLLHLGGLMALKDKGTLQKYGHELVDILKLSHMTEEQTWLDLVAEAECDPAFTTLVAQQIKLKKKKLVVRDGHTGAALEILKDLDKNLPVQVILKSDERYIPKIEALMEKLSERECNVELFFKNYWKNPQNGISTELLKKLFQKKCCVTRFTGNLDDLKVLPDTVDDIRLAIANDQQAQWICDGIEALKERLNLKDLDIGLHIMKNVSPGVLKALPVAKSKKECGTIWLSDVGDDDVSWACEIAKALLPHNMKFRSIIFPRCLLSLNGFQNVLVKLKEKGVAVSRTVKTDSTNIVSLDVISLKTSTKNELNCTFKWIEESSLW